ncbi:conserved hypothetical protein [Ricinus communis]|uniref:Uncharacterized protein n=1 Tax=Ricinus communis TaxID=3988 RepID=B9RAA5_RICCO|nr:conserved hypothetical protein [Ricinus communis]
MNNQFIGGGGGLPVGGANVVGRTLSRNPLAMTLSWTFGCWQDERVWSIHSGNISGIFGFSFSKDPFTTLLVQRGLTLQSSLGLIKECWREGVCYVPSQLEAGPTNSAHAKENVQHKIWQLRKRFRRFKA